MSPVANQTCWLQQHPASSPLCFPIHWSGHALHTVGSTPQKSRCEPQCNSDNLYYPYLRIAGPIPPEAWVRPPSPLPPERLRPPPQSPLMGSCNSPPLHKHCPSRIRCSPRASPPRVPRIARTPESHCRKSSPC